MAFGQYSANSPGRLTLAQIVPDDLAPVSRKKAGHNRALWTDERGVQHFRLIGTDVVSYDPARGAVTVDTGGFATPTTRKAIGEAFGALGLTPQRVWKDGAYQTVREGLLPGARAAVWGASQKGDGASFLRLGEGKGFRFLRRLELRVKDGEAELVRTDAQGAALAEALALSKQIKAFVKLIGDELPQPSGGDCWHCVAEANGADAGLHHLRSHLDEGYLHGTLIVNALRAAGVRDEQLPYVWRYLDRSLVRRRVSRYLRRRFGLAV